MKKRSLLISLILALVLTMLMPAAALTAKPESFSASGIITSISPGDFFPAGQSGRWRVVEREVRGTFPDGGDVTGDFTLTYNANVELMTEAGNLHGNLTIGEELYTVNMNGKIEPIEILQWVEYPPGSGNYMPALAKTTFNGHWTFTDGAKGQGDLYAWAIFAFTLEGDIDIIASEFTLTGKWQP